MQGLKRARPAALSRMKKNTRTVSRILGGNTCANCTADKITAGWLSEELTRAGSA